MKIRITTSNGSTKGYIIEAGDKLVAQSPNGSTLGWYIKSQDKTFNKSNSFIGKGNQLTLLMTNI